MALGGALGFFSLGFSGFGVWGGLGLLGFRVLLQILTRLCLPVCSPGFFFCVLLCRAAATLKPLLLNRSGTSSQFEGLRVKAGRLVTASDHGAKHAAFGAALAEQV